MFYSHPFKRSFFYAWVEVLTASWFTTALRITHPLPVDGCWTSSEWRGVKKNSKRKTAVSWFIWQEVFQQHPLCLTSATLCSSMKQLLNCKNIFYYNSYMLRWAAGMQLLKTPSSNKYYCSIFLPWAENRKNGWDIFPLRWYADIVKDSELWKDRSEQAGGWWVRKEDMEWRLGESEWWRERDEAERGREKYQFVREDEFWQSNQIRKSADLSSALPSIFFPSLWNHLQSLNSLVPVSLVYLPLNPLSFCVSLSILYLLVLSCSKAITLFYLFLFFFFSSRGG